MEQLLWPKKERTATEEALYNLMLGVLSMVYPYEQLTLAWMSNKPTEAMLLKHKTVKAERDAWWQHLQELKNRLWTDSLKYGKPELVLARNKLEWLAKSMSTNGLTFEALVMDRDTGQVETLSQAAERLLNRMRTHPSKDISNKLAREDMKMQLTEVGSFKPEVNVPEAAEQPTGDTPPTGDSVEEIPGETPPTGSSAPNES